MAQRILLMLACLSVPVFAQTRPTQSDTNPNRISIVLERNENNAWHEVDSRLVLAQNDRVRFRVRTNFSGYLYVTNLSTSGQYTVLFPAADTGKQNRVEAGKDYVVPATQGWFRIAGPPGQEVVYWLVSPVELAGSNSRTAPQTDTRSPATLVPRCDDTILRARGDCLDTTAGAKALGETVPDDMARVPALRSRELVFIRQENTSIVSSPVPLKRPVIYEFRVSHR